MLDDKKQADLDQALAALKESYPTMLWVLYQGCIREGFTIPQAMEIVVAFVSQPME
jgi:hypothetical protein